MLDYMKGMGYIDIFSLHIRVFFKNGVVQHMSGEDRYM